MSHEQVIKHPTELNPDRLYNGNNLTLICKNCSYGVQENGSDGTKRKEPRRPVPMYYNHTE